MRIAIIAPFAHAAFLPKWEGRTTGGAEFQLRSLGRLFSSMGHEVDFLMEGDEKDALEIDEGRVWQIMPVGGVPLIKLVHPKSTTLVRFLKKWKTDLLIQRGASETTALGAYCAHRVGIPFLFLLASDSDLQVGSEILPHPQDRVLYRTALSKSRWIVAQTAEQAKLLGRNHGTRADVIPSMLPPIPEGGFRDGLHDRILWGGNLRDLKRPEWVITLAKRFPEIDFLLFGGKAGGHEDYADRIISELKKLPNVEYLGWVDNHEVPSLFSRARAFLNTSIVEGFPNTFLEAWRQKIPVISTVDPGELLTHQEMGYHAEDLEATAQLVKRAWDGILPDLQPRLQKSAQYVDDIHGRDSVAGQWSKVLEVLE